MPFNAHYPRQTVTLIHPFLLILAAVYLVTESITCAAFFLL